MIQLLSKLFKSSSLYSTGLLFLLFVGVPTISSFIGMRNVEYSLLIMAFSCIAPVFNKNKSSFSFYTVDVFIWLFLLYNVLHFFWLSKNDLLYIELWQRISVLILLFLFRYLSTKEKDFYKLILILILAHFILEIILGSLQVFEAITPINKNFKLTGSFTAPSFFGVYMSIGITLMLWCVIHYYDSFKKKHLWFISFIALSALVLIILSGSRTSWVGLLLAVSILIIHMPQLNGFFKRISNAQKSLLICTIIIVSFLGGYGLYNLKAASANGRFFTAKITSQEIIKNPLFGHGLFSFSEGYNEAKVNYFSESERTWNEIKNADYMYGALNDYLEIIYEIGVLGFLLLLMIVLQIIPKKTINKYTVIGWALLVIVLVFSLFSTLLSNQSILITATAIVFLCFQQANKKELFEVDSKGIKIILCILGVVLFTYSAARIYVGATIKEKGLKNIPLNQLSLYSKILSSDGAFDFYYGQAVYKKQDKSMGLELMEQAILKNNHPKKIRKLALYYKKEGNYKRAETLLKFNIQNEPYRYEARMDLAKLYQQTNQVIKLEPLLIEIIDFPVKIPSKKVEEYKEWAQELLWILNKYNH